MEKLGIRLEVTYELAAVSSLGGSVTGAVNVRGEVWTDSYELRQGGVILRHQVVRKTGECLLNLGYTAAGEDGGGSLAVVERGEADAGARNEERN